jgi:hypothetical protein
VAAIVVAATALGLALRIYQLARPGFLLGVTEYDDGVYFGSAVRLVHGAVPYRDFVLVQPPGIVLLIAPLALLAKATGTASAFAAARIVTACVGAVGVALGGLLVRHRGPLAVALAAGLLAVYGAGIDAAHTVLLEPWLVLFCLLGALAGFEGDRVTRRPRRLAWAGAAFGFAAAIKLWAVLPLLVLAALAGRPARRRRAWLSYLGGAAVTFTLAVLPFFVLAPGSFYRDVVVAQLTRGDVARASFWARLQSLAGLSFLTSADRATIALVAIAFVGFAVVCALGASSRTRRPPPPLEWFAWLSTVLIVGAFLWPADYYPHYAWFCAPFLALSIALPAARFAGSIRGREHHAWAVALMTVAVAGVAGAMAARRFDELSTLRSGDPSPLVRRETPAGACVLADVPAVTILSDRFVSSAPACSKMVDPIGTSYALAAGRNAVTGAGRDPAVQATWLAAFVAAGYVWIQCPPWWRPGCLTARRVPWTPTLQRYFSRHFTAVGGQGPVPELFVRRRADAGPS